MTEKEFNSLSPGDVISQLVPSGAVLYYKIVRINQWKDAFGEEKPEYGGRISHIKYCDKYGVVSGRSVDGWVSPVSMLHDSIKVHLSRTRDDDEEIL